MNLLVRREHRSVSITFSIKEAYCLFMCVLIHGISSPCDLMKTMGELNYIFLLLSLSKQTAILQRIPNSPI